MKTPQIISGWKKATYTENQGACVEVAVGRAELPPNTDLRESR